MTQRALSFRSAQNCENAKHPQCKCRCGGAAHGKARITDTRELPLDDPHSPSRECEICKGRGVLGGPEGLPLSGGEGRPCWKCAGKGRYLTKQVLKASL